MTKVAVALAPVSVLNVTMWPSGVIVSVKFVVSLVLVLLLSVNFSAKTSVMIFCASGDSCTDDRKLTLP